MKKNKLLIAVTATTLLSTTNIPNSVVNVLNHSQTSGVAKAATDSGTIQGFSWFEGGDPNRPWTEHNMYTKGDDLLIMGLPVELKDGNTSQTLQTAYTDGQGKYAFTNLPDGKYLISFHNPLVWSPVSSNFDLNVSPDRDSDGPTDVRITIQDGQIVNDDPSTPPDNYISQGFYMASGATVNDGTNPALNDITDVTGTINQTLPAIPVVSTDSTLTTVKVDGLPPGVTFTPNTNQTTTTDGKITVTGEIAGIPTQVGTFPVTVTSTDAYGNVSTDTFNVVIKDIPNDKPVLTVNDTTIPYGSTFDPLSIASATDPNGDKVTITSNPKTVDTTKPGTIDVTYTATDGKDTVTKTVKLTVGEKANTAPVLDVQNTPVPYGSTFDPLSIAKATDADGDKVKITVNPTTIDTKKTGDIPVTYTADDGNGGIVEKTIIISVGEKPNTAPVLTVSDVTVDYGSKFDPLSMAKAIDVDGDTIKVTANPTTIDTTKPGVTEITFTADDGKGGTVTSKGYVTVNEKPNTAPELTVNKTDIPYGTTFDIKDYVTTKDVDGDNVTLTSGKIDTTKTGAVTVSVTADDGKGGVTTKDVTFVVGKKPNTAPELTVDKTTVPYGSDFNIKDYVSATDADKDNVIITSDPVDTKKSGDVTVKVTADDGNGGITTKDVTFKVGENSAPRIFVNDQYIVQGSKYDPMDNVFAWDAEDQDLTDKVELISGNVDVNKLGSYDLTYKVTDSGDKSRERTITVVVGMDVQKAYDSLKAITDNLTKEIASVNGKLNDHENRLKSLETQVAKNTGDIADLKQQIADQQKQIDNLKGQIDVLNNRIDAQQAQIDALKAQTDKNTVDIQSLQKDTDGLKEEAKALQDRVKTLETKVSELEKQVAQNTSDIKGLTERLDGLEAKEKHIEDQLKALESKVDKNTEDIDSLKKELTDIQKEIQTVKSEIEVLKGSMKDLQDADKTIQDKVKALESKLAELEKKASGISIQINNANTNNNDGAKTSDSNATSDNNDKGNTDSNKTDTNKSENGATNLTNDGNQSVPSDTAKKDDSKNNSNAQPTDTTNNQTSNSNTENSSKTAGILPDTGEAWSNTLLYGGVALALLGVAGYMIMRKKTKEK